MKKLVLIAVSIFLFVTRCTGVCVDGWIRFQDKCYLMSNENGSWIESSQYCQAFNTKLAEPRTTEEQQFLASYVQQDHRHYWIGITDVFVRGHWVYASDGMAIKTSNWNPGEPNRQKTQQCVGLSAGTNGKWKNEYCAQKHRFVCETEYDETGAFIGK